MTKYLLGLSTWWQGFPVRYIVGTKVNSRKDNIFAYKIITVATLCIYMKYVIGLEMIWKHFPQKSSKIPP